jgi:hypothetical protein
VAATGRIKLIPRRCDFCPRDYVIEAKYTLASLPSPFSAPEPPNALIFASGAYQDALAHWKDADPDIPILKQVKLECAKLR